MSPRANCLSANMTTSTSTGIEIKRLHAEYTHHEHLLQHLEEQQKDKKRNKYVSARICLLVDLSLDLQALQWYRYGCLIYCEMRLHEILMAESRT